MQNMPGCIGQKGVVSGSDFRALDTPIAGRPFRTDQVWYLDGRTVDPPNDVRLPVCQPRKVHSSVVDPKMSSRSSRVKHVLNDVPEKLKTRPKPLRLNGARTFRRLRKRRKSHAKDLDHENDTTLIDTKVDKVNENEQVKQNDHNTYDDVSDVDCPKTKAKDILLRPMGSKPQLMMFDVDEFRRLHDEHGPITFEAQATPYNNLCNAYCHDDKSFLEQDLKGKTVFICPLYSEQVLPMLEHFEDARSQSPLDTRAIVVLPELQSKSSNEYKHIIDRYQLLQRYPVGTYLFTNNDDDESVPEPIPWNVNVFIADHTIEDRLMQSDRDATKASSDKLNAILLEMENRKERTDFHINELKTSTTNRTDFAERVNRRKLPKPHQSRFETAICNLTNQQEDNPLLVFSAKIASPCVNVVQTDATFLLDCGASRDFISSNEVAKRSLPTEPLPQKLRVILADGRATIATHQCSVTFTANSTTFTRKCIVINMNSAYDVILGMPFLSETNPTIDWRLKHWKTPEMSFPLVCEDKAREVALNIISANAMARAIKKDTDPSTKFFLAILKKEYDYVELHNINTNTPSAIYDEIKGIKTDFDSNFTTRVQHIFEKYKSTLELPSELPPNRPNFDHEIPLVHDAKVPVSKVYRMSIAELEELRKQLDAYLSKNWIRHSTSNFAAPVLFQRKSDGSLRMCIDYRGLNKYTKRVEFPLPNVDTLLDQLSGSYVYTALDLAQGYHQIRIKDEDIYKTAFKTQYGLFEFLVMPFGLTSAPSTFQRFMNYVLKPEENTFVLVYLDDILIFSKSLDEHLVHLEKVISLLAEHQLVLRLTKCHIGKSELEYLGHTLSSKGIKPSPKKVEAVTNWPIPQNVTHVQQFLGFCNFYRRYIPHYSNIAYPLYELTRKNVSFKWTHKEHTAFLKMKQLMTTAPVLRRPNCGRDAEFVIATDASKYGIGAVLLQQDNNGKLQPCAYFAKSLSTPQRSYSTYDQELLGVVAAMSEWRVYIEGCKSITIITDHATLKHLPNANDSEKLAKVPRRYIPWLNVISPYLAINPDTNQPLLRILYRKGSENDADALSRRPDLIDQLSEFDLSTFEKDLDELHTHLSAMTHLAFDDSLLTKIRTSTKNDPALNKNTLPPGVTFSQKDNLYYFGDKLYIPNDPEIITSILYEFHDTNGHPSWIRTHANISQVFYFSKMSKIIRRYCKKCIVCERVKDRTTPAYGKNYPLPTPNRPWEYISMDFITNLPEVNGYDAIVTFVDTFTKQAHFIPCTMKISSQQLAKLYLKEIYRLHGLSRTIICDRDPRFTSSFWKTLFSQLQTKLNISSAYHPQTDGQTERTHRTIEQILRAFVHNQHHDWYDCLPLAEFSYNNSRHASTTFTPFEAIYGFNPITPPTLMLPHNPNSLDLINRIHDIHALITEQLKIAKVLQSHYADQHQIQHSFEVGDKVMLDTTNLVIRNQTTRKLRQRFLGPFTISKVVSPVSYELMLPGTMNVHPVFHISKLRIANSPDAPMDVVPARTDEQQEYVVDSIVDHKIDVFPLRYKLGPCLLFKVRWAAPYTELDDSWEPYILLKNVNVLHNYVTTNVSFKDFVKSQEYKDLCRKYPARFPADFNML